MAVSLARTCLVLRTCARVHALSQSRRLAGIEKPELVLRSLRSLCRSLLFDRSVWAQLDLHVVDDASDANLVAAWQAEVGGAGLAFQWHAIDSRTGASSFDVAIDVALRSASEAVYFLEDDYLHYSPSMPCMLRSLSQLRVAAPHEDVALTPYDCPDRYLRPYPSVLRFAEDRYWRTVRHTTGTFLVPHRVLEKHLHLYRRFAQYGREPGICEDTTINRVYQEMPCFAPIPTLAVHLQYESTIPLMLPPGGWRDLWSDMARPLPTRELGDR